MLKKLRHVSPESVLVGWDFSTGGVKCLAFNMEGKTIAEVKLPTDLWTEGGVSELNLMQMEGQARASTRAIAEALRDMGKLPYWIAGGVSATHHTAGRIDRCNTQVRRAICWNDHSLRAYHELGLKRLGGQEYVRRLIGGVWAIRYSLSHLVKDEIHLSKDDWIRTKRILPHGSLAAGFLTGNFDTVSVSSAASTGMMNLLKKQWEKEMLRALDNEEYQEMIWKQLPRILDEHEPIGPLSAALALETGINMDARPMLFPTSDDQQAGLAGGGAVEHGQMAIILGNSAVVNSTCRWIAKGDSLDVMRLNWGPFLWMRCYNNGAQFLDPIIGKNPDWKMLEAAAVACSPGCDGFAVIPFAFPEPSLGVSTPRVVWIPSEPRNIGIKFRAILEAIAYLVALGVRAHEAAGQKIKRITVSGGIARSDLMCRILATVLNRELHRLESFEGPALGAAVTALADIEMHRRRVLGELNTFTVADAVATLVKFREVVQPVEEWREVYRQGLETFERRLRGES